MTAVAFPHLWTPPKWRTVLSGTILPTGKWGIKSNGKWPSSGANCDECCVEKCGVCEFTESSTLDVYRLSTVPGDAGGTHTTSVESGTLTFDSFVGTAPNEYTKWYAVIDARQDNDHANGCAYAPAADATTTDFYVRALCDGTLWEWSRNNINWFEMEAGFPSATVTESCSGASATYTCASSSNTRNLDFTITVN